MLIALSYRWTGEQKGGTENMCSGRNITIIGQSSRSSNSGRKRTKSVAITWSPYGVLQDKGPFDHPFSKKDESRSAREVLNMRMMK